MSIFGSGTRYARVAERQWTTNGQLKAVFREVDHAPLPPIEGQVFIQIGAGLDDKGEEVFKSAGGVFLKNQASFERTMNKQTIKAMERTLS